jgi:hypothetical protein
MRVLIACEFTGTVRDAFTSLGHQAMSCDLLGSRKPGLHYRGDVRHVLNGWMPATQDAQPDVRVEYQETEAGRFERPINSPHWDLMIAHPPCTYLCSSGIHWNSRVDGRSKLTDEAIDFVSLLMDAPVARICIENPVGVLSSRIRKPDQIIQPWQYGHDASKATCLWLKDLPPLKPTRLVEPRIVHGKRRWANQTDSGQNRLGPSDDRWAIRSETYAGIASAMAEQWGHAETAWVNHKLI